MHSKSLFMVLILIINAIIVASPYDLLKLSKDIQELNLKVNLAKLELEVARHEFEEADRALKRTKGYLDWYYDNEPSGYSGSQYGYIPYIRDGENSMKKIPEYKRKEKKWKDFKSKRDAFDFLQARLSRLEREKHDEWLLCVASVI
jgi:hypothetical protein